MQIKWLNLVHGSIFGSFVNRHGLVFRTNCYNSIQNNASDTNLIMLVKCNACVAQWLNLHIISRILFGRKACRKKCTNIHSIVVSRRSRETNRLLSFRKTFVLLSHETLQCSLNVQKWTSYMVQDFFNRVFLLMLMWNTIDNIQCRQLTIFCRVKVNASF